MFFYCDGIVGSSLDGGIISNDHAFATKKMLTRSLNLTLSLFLSHKKINPFCDASRDPLVTKKK